MLSRTLLFALLALLFSSPSLAHSDTVSSHHRKDTRRDHRTSHHKGHHAKKQRGFLEIENPNRASVIVRIDGERVGEVRASSSKTFGPYNRGEYRVRVVYVSADGDLRVPLERAKIKIKGGHTSVLYVSYNSDVRAPHGQVRVSNPLHEDIELVDRDGRVIERLDAHDSRVVSLPAGHVELWARVRGVDFASVTLHVDPEHRSRWDIPAPTYARLRVSNDRRYDIAVYIDDRLLGWVGANSSVDFESVPVGYVQVTLVAQRHGEWFEHTREILIDPIDGGSMELRSRSRRDSRSRIGDWG